MAKAPSSGQLLRSLAGTLRRLERAVVWALLLVTPRRRHLVISGFPDTEGNAIEMLRACIRRYRGPIFLLVVDSEVARRVLSVARLDDLSNVVILPRRSLRAIARFVTAEVVMFTHGLYGNPARTARKTLVNLWHGGGIKGNLMEDARGRPTIHSDYLVAATSRQGEILARQCRLPAGGLLLTGNPRVDQFGTIDSAGLEALGIDAGQPFVLWMPTFRKNAGHGLTVAWTESKGATAEVDARAETVVESLVAAGIQVIVKPHPSDAEHHAVNGTITVTDHVLISRGVLLYQLIGASSGLLTDYSSVWIDYLTLDRPIAFLVPDADSFADGRGFSPPDALDWLPGPRIETAKDVADFAEDVKAGGSLTAARRGEVAAHIGLATARPVAGRILEELESRGVFSGGLLPSDAEVAV